MRYDHKLQLRSCPTGVGSTLDLCVWFHHTVRGATRSLVWNQRCSGRQVGHLTPRQVGGGDGPGLLGPVGGPGQPAPAPERRVPELGRPVEKPKGIRGNEIPLNADMRPITTLGASSQLSTRRGKDRPRPRTRVGGGRRAEFGRPRASSGSQNPPRAPHPLADPSLQTKARWRRRERGREAGKKKSSGGEMEKVEIVRVP